VVSTTAAIAFGEVISRSGGTVSFDDSSSSNQQGAETIQQKEQLFTPVNSSAQSSSDVDIAHADQKYASKGHSSGNWSRCNGIWNNLRSKVKNRPAPPALSSDVVQKMRASAARAGVTSSAFEKNFASVY